MAIPGSRQNRPGPGSQGPGGRGGYPRPSPYNNSPSSEENVARTPALAPAPPPRAVAAATPPGAFSGEEVRELMRLVNEHDITELLLERDNGAQRLVIKRDRPAPAPVLLAQPAALAPAHPREIPTSLASNPTPGSVIPDPGAPPQDSFHKIIAPMVGTFYSGPDPKDPPFVSVGETVEKDQVIGIIEAMKIMNEIKSEHSGRCMRVAVENGQPVEYGQTIMLLEPA